MKNWIEHIEIDNFKSIQHQVIDGCKRINVFIGYPNVGKSNILEALSLFSLPYLSIGGKKKLTEFIRVENLRELFCNANADKDISVKLNGGDISFKASIDMEAAYPLECRYNFSQPDLNDTGFKKLTHDLFFNEYKILFNELLISRFENKNTLLKDVFTTKRYKFLADSAKKSKKHFNFLVPPYGINLFSLIEENKELKEFVTKELKKVGAEYIYDKSENIGKVWKTVGGEKFSLPFSSMADTFQRLIFYSAAVQTNSRSVLLFEEPETHMFPPYISRFTGDIIYEKNDNQYFIATHSPFVISDFLENKDVLDEVSVYLVGYNKGTYVKRLSEDELHEIRQYGVDLFFNIESYLEQ